MGCLCIYKGWRSNAAGGQVVINILVKCITTSILSALTFVGFKGLEISYHLYCFTLNCNNLQLLLLWPSTATGLETLPSWPTYLAHYLYFMFFWVKTIFVMVCKLGKMVESNGSIPCHFCGPFQLLMRGFNCWRCLVTTFLIFFFIKINNNYYYH